MPDSRTAPRSVYVVVWSTYIAQLALLHAELTRYWTDMAALAEVHRWCKPLVLMVQTFELLCKLDGRPSPNGTIEQVRTSPLNVTFLLLHNALTGFSNSISYTSRLFARRFRLKSMRVHGFLY
jgi:hypothetical protein